MLLRDHPNNLRWLKADFRTFQDVDFDVSLLPLVINCCYNHGIKKLPKSWLALIIFITIYVTIATL